MQILLDLQSSLPALGNYVYGLFGFFVPSFFGVGVFAFCLVWFGLVLLLWAFDAFCIVELCTFDSVTGRSGNNASAEIPVRRGMCGHTCGAGTPVVWAHLWYGHSHVWALWSTGTRRTETGRV